MSTSTQTSTLEEQLSDVDCVIIDEISANRALILIITESVTVCDVGRYRRIIYQQGAASTEVSFHAGPGNT